VPLFEFLSKNVRWLTAGFLLTYFSGFGQTFFISLFVGDIRSEFGLSHGDFGSVYMGATLASALALTYVGRSVDRFSVIQVASAVIILLGTFAASMALASSLFLIGVTLFGLRLFGQGMMTHTSLTAMARWYSAQRGRAVSIATVGFTVGEATLPVSFVALSAAFGWRAAWGIAAGILVFIALPVVRVLLRKDRTPHAAHGGDAGETGRQWTRKEVLGDPLFWAMSAGILAPPFIGTAIIFHQVYLSELRGWSRELFASAFIVMSMTSLTAALLVGAAVDRFSAIRIMPFLLIPITLACLCLAVFHGPFSAFLFMGLLGISAGGSSTLVGALWPELYGTRYLGSVRSVIFAMMVFSSALGPGLVGWMIDAGIEYDGQILGMAGYCAFISLALAAAAPRARHRRQRELTAATS